MTSQNGTSVLVIGGGIGGFSSALVLRRLGAEVTLVEQAPEFAEVGAGLQMAPNATRLLKRWDLLEEAIASGVAPGRIVFRDATTGEDLLEQDVTGEFTERYGAPYIVAHRADLHRLLWTTAEAEGVRLHTNTHVVSVDQSEDSVTIIADDGRSFTADALIAADGIKSVVRERFSNDEPVGSEYVAYRGAIPTSQAAHTKDLDSVVIWIGPECHLVQYALRDGDLFNTVAVYRSSSFAAGQLEYKGDDELRAAYRECVPDVQNAVDNVNNGMRWPMFDRIPIPRWNDGRICLIGDAAHPMLQYLAQGACQAVEDAGALEYLASAMVFANGKADPSAWPKVFEELTAMRQPRTARVQHTARVWGEAWHLVGGVERTVRNMLFESVNRHGVWEYSDWLYGPQDHEPEERA